MDGTNEKTIDEERKGSSFSAAIESRRENPSAILYDATAFALAFLFARCHLLFGSHPIALAFLAALPSRIFISLAGAVAGSLTLGSGGIIYGMICGVVVFLRLAVSGGKEYKSEPSSRSNISENPLFRLAACVIAGFIISVYEVLLSGFNKTSVVFSLTMIIATPLLSVIFSFLFDKRISLASLKERGALLFSDLSSRADGLRTSVLFRISAAATLFLVSFSLSDFELLGISLSFVFSAVTTLAVAKRFGWIYGAAVGFSTAIAISPIQAISFALAGIASGILFKIGASYAMMGGCIALSAWSAYTEGLLGFLSSLPEYLIGAALAYPIISKLPGVAEEKKAAEDDKSAQDMVGTMSLAYKNRLRGHSAELEALLSELSPIISAFGAGGASVKEEDAARILDEEAAYILNGMSDGNDRQLLSAALFNSRERIVKKLLTKERLAASDLPLPSDALGITVGDGVCVGIDGKASELIGNLNTRMSVKEKERYHRPAARHAEEYAGIAKMISEARCRDEAEKAVDTALSEKISAVFEEFGFSGGVVRVFGERYKHVIAAGEDSDGLKITSPELKDAIEKAAGIKLSLPEYYRRGKYVLMEATSARKFAAEFAFAQKQGSEKEISGDTVLAFESNDDRFFALISDGMGSGEIARETSLFAGNFLRAALSHGFPADASLHILNDLIRASAEECSATVDLFEFDLMNSEAKFLKSGAAGSYVKRGSSIFRIRSRTAPIGLIKTVDAEKVRVEIKCEDYVIMLSDGINPTSDDAPWLLELLSKPVEKGAKALASRIIEEAEKHSRSRDDMSALVIKISAI